MKILGPTAWFLIKTELLYIPITYNCTLLEGNTGFLVHTGRIAGCVLKQCVTVSREWKQELLTASIFYWTGWCDANNEAAASLSVCLPGPDWYWCVNYHSSYSDILRWQTGTWRCVDARSHRLVESSGAGWTTAFDSKCQQCGPPVQNAESTEKQSNNITKAGGQPADSSGY